MNSRFRPYRIILPRQGGSINIIQVTVYSFTVPALKLMNVKFCLFLATTAHCHDRAAIKIHSQLLIALICMCAAETYTILIVFGYPMYICIYVNTTFYRNSRISRLYCGKTIKDRGLLFGMVPTHILKAKTAKFQVLTPFGSLFFRYPIFKV